MATATVETKDQDDMHAPTTGLKAARAAVTDIPDSVQNALMNDGNAARSLARQFEGNEAPDWYNEMPKASRQLFQTAATPRISTTPEPTITCPPNKKYTRKDRGFRKREAKVGKYRSKFAKAESELADYISCSALKKEAKRQSEIAKAEKKHANVKNSAATSTVPKTSMLFAVSVTVAAATLGLAAYL